MPDCCYCGRPSDQKSECVFLPSCKHMVHLQCIPCGKRVTGDNDKPLPWTLSYVAIAISQAELLYTLQLDDAKDAATIPYMSGAPATITTRAPQPGLTKQTVRPPTRHSD